MEGEGGKMEFLGIGGRDFRSIILICVFGVSKKKVNPKEKRKKKKENMKI